MGRAVLRPAVAADAAAVTELIVALESSLYGESTFAQADQEDEWSDLDLARDVRVLGDGDRVVGYGAVHELGGMGRAEGYVPPDALGRGIGTMVDTGLEEAATLARSRPVSSRPTRPAAGRWSLRMLRDLGDRPALSWTSRGPAAASRAARCPGRATPRRRTQA